jgi:hypothetical protein
MVTPGKITLTDTRFAVGGAKADLSVAMEPASRGTSVAVAARFEGADIGQLARMLGMGRPPLEGRLSARATLTTSGLSIPEALKASRGAVVLPMNGRAVSRQLMHIAAADLRALFGGGKGSARITCLLAIAELQGLAVPLAPIRLATSEGTIEGFGQIDLWKRCWMRRFELNPRQQARSRSIPRFGSTEGWTTPAYFRPPGPSIALGSPARMLSTNSRRTCNNQPVLARACDKRGRPAKAARLRRNRPAWAFPVDALAPARRTGCTAKLPMSVAAI